jgi:putative membrane protein
MSLSMILFWGLIIWGVITLVRYLGATNTSPSDPRQILAQRFARGEISEEEYIRGRTVVAGQSDTQDAAQRRAG